MNLPGLFKNIVSQFQSNLFKNYCLRGKIKEYLVKPDKISDKENIKEEKKDFEVKRGLDKYLANTDLYVIPDKNKVRAGMNYRF